MTNSSQNLLLSASTTAAPLLAFSNTQQDQRGNDLTTTALDTSNITDLRTGLGAVLGNVGNTLEQVKTGIEELLAFQIGIDETIGKTSLPLLGELGNLASAPLEFVTNIQSEILGELGAIAPTILEPIRDTIEIWLGNFVDVSTITDDQLTELTENLLDAALQVDLASPDQVQEAEDFFIEVKAQLLDTFTAIDSSNPDLDTAIENFTVGLSDRLTEELNNILGQPLGHIRQAILDSIGPDGSNYLKDVDGDNDIDIDDVRVNITDINQLQDIKNLDIKFGLILGKEAEENSINTTIAADLGFPGLGLEIEGNPEAGLGIDWELGFGFNKNDGVYFDTASGSELELNFSASTPGLSAEGTLGFLKFNVTDQSDDPSIVDTNFIVNVTDPNNDGKLTVDDLSQIEFDPTIDLAADINLDLNSSLGDDALFPSIGTTFHLDWSADNESLDPYNLQNLGNIPTVEFGSVTLDLGEFISTVADPVSRWLQLNIKPVEPCAARCAGGTGFCICFLIVPRYLLETITTILQPLDPVIKALTQDINLGFAKFNLLDVAELFGDVGDETIAFIETLDQLNRLIQLIDDNADSTTAPIAPIELGGFDFNGIDLRSPTFNLNQVTPDIPTGFDPNIPLGSFESDFIAQATIIPGKGIQFPFLSDPSQIFNLFLGKNANFITYDLPAFNLGLKQDIPLPVVGPLSVILGGEIGAEIDISGIGFDAQGLMDFAAGNYSTPSTLFNGFYVSDRANLDDAEPDIPEVELTAALEAAAEFNLGGLASFGAGGGLYAGVNFDLNDPDGDGRVRANEFADNFPDCLFDVYGDLTARLFAYLKFGLGIFSATSRIDSPDLTLLDFNHGCDGSRDSNTPNPPPLAIKTGTVLELQTGDNSDDFIVEHVSGTTINETVQVFAFGARVTRQSINLIVANAGQGDDYIKLGDDILAMADLSGGSGNDHLVGGNRGDSLTSDSGVDRLDGGKGNDTLNGNEDDDILIGGPGADILNGGIDEDTASYITAETGVRVNLTNPTLNTSDAAGDIYISIARIEGSHHNDQLTGNNGQNDLAGLDGSDRLRGRGGRNTLDGGAGDDELYGGEGRDLLAGGSGADILDGGNGEDTISYTDSTKGLTIDLRDDTDTGYAVGDDIRNAEIIEGSYYHDIFKGDSNETTFLGLDGNDIFFGRGRGDTLSGGNGYDIASYADAGAGLIIDLQTPTNSTGHAADDIYFSIEEFNGSPFNDTLVGKSGNGQHNILDGLEGNNILRGGNINDIRSGTYDLRAGTGNDSYQLASNQADGGIIRDRGGDNDVLILDDIELDLARPGQATSDLAGLARRGNDLIIDVDKSKDIDRTKDLTIENFFAFRNFSINDIYLHERDSGTQQAIFTITADGANSGVGIGFIERLDNLLGEDIIQLFNTVQVDYETVDGTATIADQDYQFASGTVSFLPNETQKNVVVNINGDLREENNQDFTLSLSSRNSNILDGSGRGTIANDDTSITIDSQIISEGDTETVTAELIVRLSLPSQEVVTVNYTPQDQTAIANEDYVPISGQIQFNPGETEKVIAVNILADTEPEADETLTVQLTDATNGDIVDGEGLVTILDNDDPTIAISDVILLEGDSGTIPMTFTVNLSKPTAKTVSVEYATKNERAIAGLDYIPISGVITFAPGEVSKMVTVNGIGDKRIEANEIFTIELSNSTNATILDGRGVGALRNDDRLELSINQIIVDEGDAGDTTTTIFTVSLSDRYDDVVTVDYSTADITAIASTDYTATAGTLTFNPGETEQQIQVEILGDDLDEIDEQFQIALSNANAGTIITPTTLDTIRDEDMPTLTVADVMLIEGDTGLTMAEVKVQLSEAGASPVTLNYHTVPDSADANGDYQVTQGFLVLAPGETEQIIDREL